MEKYAKLDYAMHTSILMVPTWCHQNYHEWVNAYGQQPWNKPGVRPNGFGTTYQYKHQICKYCHKRSNDKD